MGNRHSMPYQPRAAAARSALFAAAALLAVPALATTTGEMPCPYTAKATLDIAATKLVTRIVITENDESEPAAAPDIEVETISIRLLAPRAEAAIREAFNESGRQKPSDTAGVALTETIVAPLEAIDTPIAGTETKAVLPLKNRDKLPPVSEMNTRLPGVSDDDLSRYKKQMYRRDI